MKRFLIGALLNSLGGGLTLPVMVVYLNQVRHMSMSSASLVLSWMAITGLAFSPIFGTLVDRFGPRPILLGSILIEAIGTASWSLADSVPRAYLVGTVVALGNAGIWPPQSTLMSRMVSAEDRQKFFGLQFMALNLGLGVGGMVSSFIVRVERPESFTTLYLLDAASYLTYFAFIASLRGIGGRLKLEEGEEENAGSYREVLRDRRLIKLSIVGVVMMTCGYASMDAGLPALLTVYGGLSVSQLGPLWAVNTSVIVVLQISILNRLEGRSRTRLLGVVCALWAAGWFVTGIGVARPGATFFLACVGTAIFAVGETIWSPIGASLQNVIAPEHLRGRYNAISGLVWVISGTLGPAISGVLLQQARVNLWLGMILVGLTIAGFLGVRLRQELTPEEDGRILSN